MSTHTSERKAYPNWLVQKWQEIVDLLAEVLDIPAALIMRHEEDYMEVLISSKTENNPYKPGDKEKWYGLYCETVIKDQKLLMIPDARKDKDWDSNPDLKLGMVAYMGLPINAPEYRDFGTICILDRSEVDFRDKHEKLLTQFKSVIELDLALVNSFDIQTSEMAQTIDEQKNELIQNNKELRIAKEKAEESDKLKSIFLQNISHEIRTPMNAIMGFSGLLDDDQLPHPDRRRYINIIQKSSTQLLDTVSDILTISFLDSETQELNEDEFYVNETLSSLYHSFSPKANIKGLELKSCFGRLNKKLKIYADQNKLQQILHNLIGNAIKFSKTGKIEFGYAIKEEHLEFFVKDQGIGIREDMTEKIFERFRQGSENTQELYGGTGLGLSISKAFVELMGGKIWVNSKPGKGSEFYFTIPYSTSNNQLESRIPNSENDNPTILVAEDEENNFFYIEAILNKDDYKILHAKNGDEAVQFCKKNSDIALILMDIRMPLMDGLEAVKQIRKINSEVPIIAQTAYALDYEKDRFKNNFDSYLTKPLNPDELRSKVAYFINPE